MPVSASSHCCAEASFDLCLPHDADADSLQILEKIHIPHVRRVFQLVMRESKVLNQGAHTCTCSIFAYRSREHLNIQDVYFEALISRYLKDVITVISL